MRSQPKYKLGDEISVSFMGTIVSVHFDYKHRVQYKVHDDKTGNDAYILENYAYPLPTPEDFQIKEFDPNDPDHERN